MISSSVVPPSRFSISITWLILLPSRGVPGFAIFGASAVFGVSSAFLRTSHFASCCSGESPSNARARTRSSFSSVAAAGASVAGLASLFAGTSSGAASGSCGAARELRLTVLPPKPVQSRVPVRIRGGSRPGPHPQTLDCFPDPRDGLFAVGKFLYRRSTRKAVPDFYEPGCRPVRGQLRQGGFGSEAFSVNDGFRFHFGGVDCDVVRFVFDA